LKNAIDGSDTAETALSDMEAAIVERRNNAGLHLFEILGVTERETADKKKPLYLSPCSQNLRRYLISLLYLILIII
jgi:hypothetical protein